MALDAKQKAKFQALKLKCIYEKQAKVAVKDLELFAVNMSLLIVCLFLIIVGCTIIGIFLEVYDGKNAYAYIFSSKNSDSKYGFYIGAHFGAVLVGLGVFILILCLVGFSDDYVRTKKRLVEKIIKEDQDRAAAETAKNANMNLFQMLAKNIKNSKFAN
jgi:hypothetical protein